MATAKKQIFTENLVGLTSGSILIKVFSSGNEVIGQSVESGGKWWCEVYRTEINDILLKVIKIFPIELDLVSDWYDFKVHFYGMEMWLHGVFIEKGKTTTLTVNINDKHL